MTSDFSKNRWFGVRGSLSLGSLHTGVISVVRGACRQQQLTPLEKTLLIVEVLWRIQNFSRINARMCSLLE